MSILVTGANGFIGRALTRKLNELEIPWHPFVGDVTESASFSRAPACEAVVHLAGLVRPGPTTPPSSFFSVNLGGAVNAARFAVERGVPLFFAGSCAYATDQKAPFHEDMKLITRTAAYASSKSLADEALIAMGGKNGLRGISFRIFNLYGPGQPKGFLIPDIITKVCEAHATGKITMDNLESVRDFIHVDDFIDLLILTLAPPLGPMQPLNAGSGCGRSVREVVSILQKHLGTAYPVTSPESPCDLMRSMADIGKAELLYGWKPKSSFEQGLLEVIDHTLSALSLARPQGREEIGNLVHDLTKGAKLPSSARGI